MTIKELVSDNINKGYKLKDAENLAAEEIILKKIASSDMAEHVTLKGGIVMYNLTKNNRRVTQDIDFDLIRYSIDKESIKAFTFGCLVGIFHASRHQINRLVGSGCFEQFQDVVAAQGTHLSVGEDAVESVGLLHGFVQVDFRAADSHLMAQLADHVADHGEQRLVVVNDQDVAL